MPFVGPNGEAYAAWNDFSKANNITVNRSFDGGVTWGTPTVIAAKTVPFEILVPAESFRGALIYPACDADRSSGPHRGRLYCSWMDLTAAGVADIFLSFSDDRGTTWSARKAAWSYGQNIQMLVSAVTLREPKMLRGSFCSECRG